jgi:hypothetical protein
MDFLDVWMVVVFGWIVYFWIVYKSIWEIWQKWDAKLNLHYNLSNPKKNYQKDKCSIQGGLYKGWYIQCA